MSLKITADDVGKTVTANLAVAAEELPTLYAPAMFLQEIKDGTQAISSSGMFMFATEQEVVEYINRPVFQGTIRSYVWPAKQNADGFYEFIDAKVPPRTG